MMFDPTNPMPTIESICGSTMARDISQSIMLAQLDDFEVPQCESPTHNTAPDHHSGPAGFLMQTPCGHGDGYRCVAFAKWILSHQVSHCENCGMSGPPSDLIFLPIGGQK